MWYAKFWKQSCLRVNSIEAGGECDVGGGGGAAVLGNCLIRPPSPLLLRRRRRRRRAAASNSGRVVTPVAADERGEKCNGGKCEFVTQSGDVISDDGRRKMKPE